MKMASMGSLVLFLMISTSSAQEDWISGDSRSNGMGGAGVSMTDARASGFDNPSLLSLGQESFGWMTGGFGLQGSFYIDTRIEGDVLATVDQIADLYQGLDFANVQNNLNSATASNQDLRDAYRIIQSIIQLGKEEEGVVGGIGGGIDIRLGPFALYVRQMAQVGINPFFDFSVLNSSSLTSAALGAVFMDFTGGGALDPEAAALRDALVAVDPSWLADNDGDGIPDGDELAFHAQQSLGNAGIADPAFVQAFIQTAQATTQVAGGGAPADPLTLFFNGSGVEIKGVTLREIGLSGSFPIFPIFSVGATFRMIVGETFRTTITLADLQDGEEVLDELRKNFTENRKRTTRFTVDLGASAKLFDILTIGLVAKNLIPIEFDYDGTSAEYELDPQLRFGATLHLFDMLKIGVDFDILEQDLDSLVDGLKSRVISFGAQFQFGWDLIAINLRAGGFHDFSAPESNPVFSFGVGVQLLGFFVDANGQVGFRKAKIESSSLLNGSSTKTDLERLGGSITVGFQLDLGSDDESDEESGDE